MEKDGPLSSSNANPSATGGAASKNSIRAVNKSSHKISKIANATTLVRSNPQALTITDAKQQSDCNCDQTNNRSEAPVPVPAPAPAPAPPPQPQPPVYNINKNDFRDVVQKLTGSPAHLGSCGATAPPTAKHPVASSSSSSRLQKNRPPPLSQIGPHPPPAAEVGGAYLRPWMSTPLSPLPPLPTVSAAAESPITAYMRCLRGGGGGGGGGTGSTEVPLFPLPTSPLGFGCLPSPQAALPSSPQLPIPSPKWEQP